MYKLELYKGDKTYMAPAGTIYTPERIEQDFPAITLFPHLIQTDSAGQTCFAVLNFAATKDQYGISQGTSDKAAITAIEKAMNEVPVEEPSAEERIAAALEFQNVMSL